MRVLEVGPGNGTWAMAIARRVGDNGKVIPIDMAQSSGFQLKKKIGNLVYYTLIFEKSSEPLTT
jgi:ubiquinone/menaquinone biosynthesis C-methylase UbiE